MARFDLHRPRGGPALVVDVQSDFLDNLRTRVVVPLVPPGEVPRPVRDLHPVFAIDGMPCLLATQFLAAIPSRDLGRAVGTLKAERDAITRALDLLLTGF